MEDREIVALYWARNPEAIRATAAKYENYCRCIAKNVLGSQEDAEECVNDAYFSVWNSIPPHKPYMLSAYLGKITRNAAFDRWRKRRSEKRGGGEIELVLSELGECVSGEEVEQKIDQKELVEAINCFLNTLSPRKRDIFLCRYWYAAPISEIARRFGLAEGNVSVTLNRIRAKLRKYLTERGYER